MSVVAFTPIVMNPIESLPNPGFWSTENPFVWDHVPLAPEVIADQFLADHEVYRQQFMDVSAPQARDEEPDEMDLSSEESSEEDSCMDVDYDNVEEDPDYECSDSDEEPQFASTPVRPRPQAVQVLDLTVNVEDQQVLRQRKTSSKQPYRMPIYAHKSVDQKFDLLLDCSTSEEDINAHKPIYYSLHRVGL